MTAQSRLPRGAVALAIVAVVVAVLAPLAALKYVSPERLWRGL
ncbi:hypothetical protein [Halosimplex marinum]